MMASSNFDDIPISRRSHRGSKGQIYTGPAEDESQDGNNSLFVPESEARNQSVGAVSPYVKDLESAITALGGQQVLQRIRLSHSRRSRSNIDLDESPRSERLPANDESRLRADTFMPKEEPNSGWKLEIKRWKRVNNRYGSSDLYDESEKIEDIRKREQEIRSGGYPILIYDEFDTDGNKMHILLEVESSALLDLLRRVITFHPGDEFDVLRGKDQNDGEGVAFSDPFMIFWDHTSQLKASLQGDFPEDAKQHVGLLLGFLKKEYPVTSAKLAEIQEGRCKKISYEKLWLLYSPNTAVYARKGSDIRQMVVYARVRNPNKTLKLTCWETKCEKLVNLPCGGNAPKNPLTSSLAQGVFKRGFSELDIEPYAGEKSISNLELVPVQYMDKKDELHMKLVERGKRYFEMNKAPLLQSYFGDKFPRIYKDVTLVKVDDLQPVQFRERAFKRLVIRDDHKNLIKAMVQAYKEESPGFADVVAGKGRGLFILLHGPPGVGKTLTAECVAEKQQLPLYTISCGDLGTEPEVLEERLKKIFEYCCKWKAVLLLDEADIFLQERDIQDVKRNALVSIFLRELDYFEGILFLTTNRPGDIDEAFVSRIHVTLGLSSLNKAEQRKVWTIFFKDLELEESGKVALLRYVDEKFTKDNLNGRQIRNTVRTALALANAAHHHLKAEHLESVVQIGREYSGYLANLNHMNAEEYAVALGRRAPERRDAAR
ncbi:uncharacterized protein KY384_004930 [Bacidia gigantensis]|uniref:uncharacterized protein n=1 Tax=Bacidia gigantensis TaxID=2732470 RepID=UPI001D05B64E|nr:uncharacterized protein KY384_004930 [Bacidia gigantensis]KAG8530428.1 hypothetical protein KY384_004930 [Bacidia gigantensis]